MYGSVPPWVSKFKGENNVNMRVSFQIWIQLITITFHYNVQTEACFVLLTFMTEILKMFSSQITTNAFVLPKTQFAQDYFTRK